MSYFQIPRISADIDLFMGEYYRPRRPVILEGVRLGEAFTQSLTPEHLGQLLSSKKDAVHERANAWIIDDDSFFTERPQWPPFCTELLRRISLSQPPTTRLWTSSSRTFTAWHYDGNSADGLNCSVVGRKRWTLVSPDTPLPWFAFSQASPKSNEPLNDAEKRNLKWTEFELLAGDLLFLPRHWFHHVQSLADWNANLNWIWTDRSVPLNTKTSLREVEMVALRYCISSLRKNFLRQESKSDYLETYGGVGNFAMPRDFLKRTGYLQLIPRLFMELAALPSRRTLRKLRQRRTALNDGVPRSAGDYWAKKPKSTG